MKSILIKIFFIISSVLLGLLFIYSGYTKLFPIEPFEYTFVDLGVANWGTAPFIARFMIGLEFFIGIMLVFNLYLKRFTLKLTIATLVFFTVYLIIMILTSGNNGNCGCFGTAIVMSPAQAILKNVIMLGFCFLLLKFHAGYEFGSLSKWLSIALACTAFALPHILNYVDLDYSQAYLNKPEDHFDLPLDSLYKDAAINVPPQSLKKGKQIIAFLSASCSHCRIAAKKLRLMKEKNPELPIYMVINGEDLKFKQFFEDTKADNLPYCRLNGRNFVYMAGVTLPMIYLVNNSIVETNVNYMELDQDQIEKWLNQP
jgi:hypothetical protein